MPVVRPPGTFGRQSSSIVIDVSDAYRVAAEVRFMEIRIPIEAAAIVTRYGAALLTTVQRNVSSGHHPPGRPHIPGTGPGPNVATGDYRRSWNLRVSRQARSTIATVGTPAVQGPRLERGFAGYDAAGRLYDQPPFPHAEPALEEIGPQFAAAMTAAIAKTLER